MHEFAHVDRDKRLGCFVGRKSRAYEVVDEEMGLYRVNHRRGRPPKYRQQEPAAVVASVIGAPIPFPVAIEAEEKAAAAEAAAVAEAAVAVEEAPKKSVFVPRRG